MAEEESKQPKQLRGKGFQKGVTSNPYGARGKDPTVAILKKQSKERLMQAIADMLPKPVETVERIAKAKNSRACDALIASVIMKGIKQGSPAHAQFFMSYTFGRPIEYDPSEEDAFLESAYGGAQGLPKDLLIQLLTGLQNANAKPSAVPAAT